MRPNAWTTVVIDEDHYVYTLFTAAATMRLLDDREHFGVMGRGSTDQDVSGRGVGASGRGHHRGAVGHAGVALDHLQATPATNHIPFHMDHQLPLEAEADRRTGSRANRQPCNALHQSRRVAIKMPARISPAIKSATTSFPFFEW